MQTSLQNDMILLKRPTPGNSDLNSYHPKLVAHPLTIEFLRAGWTRWLPGESMLLHLAVIFAEETGAVGDLEDQDADSPVGQALATLGGLDAAAWGSLERDGDAEDVALAREAATRLDRAASDLGLGPVATNRELLAFMRRVDIVARVEASGEVTWRPVRPVALPEERLVLTAGERESEAQARWREAHEETVLRLVRFFARHGAGPYIGTLEDLADSLGVPVESARHALVLLLEEGDLSTTDDLERLDQEARFELAFDWDRYRLARPGP